MAGGAPGVYGAGTRNPDAGGDGCEAETAEESTPNENTQGNSLHSKHTCPGREGLCQRGKEAWIRSGKGCFTVLCASF